MGVVGVRNIIDAGSEKVSETEGNLIKNQSIVNIKLYSASDEVADFVNYFV